MDFAFNLTNNSFKTQVYNTEGLYTYTIPKGVTTVFILVVGSGGGGGGGFTRASGSAGGGGGGGGTGAISRIIIPKIFLTNSLIVQVPSGGSGGAAGVAGSSGSASTVWLNNLITPVTNPNTLSGNTIIITASGGTAGGGGTSLGGSAGSGGNASTATSMKIASLGEFTSRQGINGGDGGSPAAGNVLYGGGSIPFSAGRGGGGMNAATPGTNRDGGGITGKGFVPDFDNLNAGGGVGIDGLFMMKPFVSLGGCGGGSNNAGKGGGGGKGAPGTGGGGGGAGTTPGFGGTGGKGGDGLVIICCW
jgi:hypothetical protein